MSIDLNQWLQIYQDFFRFISILIEGWKWIYNPKETWVLFFLKELLLCDVIYIELFTRNIEYLKFE